jgi:hypothetical protein
MPQPFVSRFFKVLYALFILSFEAVCLQAASVLNYSKKIKTGNFYADKKIA